MIPQNKKILYVHNSHTLFPLFLSTDLDKPKACGRHEMIVYPVKVKPRDDQSHEVKGYFHIILLNNPFVSEIKHVYVV